MSRNAIKKRYHVMRVVPLVRPLTLTLTLSLLSIWLGSAQLLQLDGASVSWSSYSLLFFLLRNFKISKFRPATALIIVCLMQSKMSACLINSYFAPITCCLASFHAHTCILPCTPDTIDLLYNNSRQPRVSTSASALVVPVAAVLS